MIVQRKEGGKKIYLTEEEITLDKLRECADILHAPNIPLNERSTVVSFPKLPFNVKESKSEELEAIAASHREAMNEECKVYEVLADEVGKQLQKAAALGLLFGDSEKILPEGTELKDLKKEEVRFTEIYVEGLGQLIIKRD